MGPSEPVALEPMAQQPPMLGLEDDWTGISSSATRRRLQNRLNQRAHRIRKRNEKRASLDISKTSQQVSRHQTCLESITSSAVPQIPETETETVLPITAFRGLSLFYAAAKRRTLDRHELRCIASVCRIGANEQQEAVSELKRWIENGGGIGSPTIDHLLVLVKFNVFRAMLSNGIDLGYQAGKGLDDDNALSPFSEPSNSARVLLVPPSLQPTNLQRRIPHHPWIDTIPIPRMRDNFLRAGDTYDDDALCSDLVGFCNEPTGRTGMILWGEPWDPNAWEITEEFVKYWGWTIRGCRELVDAANFWREQRGEEPLKLDGVLIEDVSD